MALARALFSGGVLGAYQRCLSTDQFGQVAFPTRCTMSSKSARRTFRTFVEKRWVRGCCYATPDSNLFYELEDFEARVRKHVLALRNFCLSSFGREMFSTTQSAKSAASV